MEDKDSLEKALDFLENKSPRVIKQYFGQIREKGDGDSHPELILDDSKKTDDEVLEPEHPLLEKFQLALKDHLQKQIEHLKNDIFEYETGAKKTNADREVLGVQAYATQQSVTQQQGEIDGFLNELEDITETRDKTEQNLQECLSKYKEEKRVEFEEEKNEIELRKEVESVHLLLQQMLDWEKDIECELKTNQRMFEKTRKDKLQLANEKRELDALVFRLMSEVWKLEGELETILMQLRVKEEEREKLAENLAMSNTDIEATQAEHRCLIRGWHSVVIAIGARDKHYNQIYQELMANNEKLRSIISETQQVKKLCSKEMNINESLTLFKSKVEADINVCKHQLDIEETKRTVLERKIMQIQMIIEQTEKDLQRVIRENHIQSRQIQSVFVEVERYNTKKMELEESIMVALQNQITNDKATKFLTKTLSEIKAKNRLLEITLSTTENKNARVLMDIESQKRVNNELEMQLNEFITEQNDIEAKLNSITDQSVKLTNLMNKREREVHILNRRLEVLIEKVGDTERSPHELKISALEQHIAAIQEKNKELQRFWLREQGHVVCLSEQRQQQIHDSNILRKQIMILEQRNLKVNDELEVYKKQEENMTRSINKLQNQLGKHTEQLGKKKNSKQFLDETNEVLQTDFTFRLKDLEMDVIRLESDIQDLQNDIQELTEELLNKNREALEWEKHWKMLVETKKNLHSAKGEGGEISNMLSEIQRMRVRYGQLKKAQDKLIQDLDHCILRRDAIVTNAEAREKRVKGSQNTLIFARKLDDTRNKLKQLQDDTENLETQMEHLEEESKHVHEQIISSKQDIDQLIIKGEDLKQKIEVERTDKQLKLDLLLINQRKLKMYVELSKGRMPYLVYKSDSRIAEEYTKQKDINDRLQHAAEKLMQEIPAHKQMFLRILNTLKLSTVM